MIKTVKVSDLSLVDIPDGSGATITVTFADKRMSTVVIDATTEEGVELTKDRGRRVRRRGRKPKPAV